MLDARKTAFCKYLCNIFKLEGWNNLKKKISIKCTESPSSVRNFPVAVERLDFAKVISTLLELLVANAPKEFRKIS